MVYSRVVQWEWLRAFIQGDGLVILLLSNEEWRQSGFEVNNIF